MKGKNAKTRRLLVTHFVWIIAGVLARGDRAVLERTETEAVGKQHMAHDFNFT